MLGELHREAELGSKPLREVIVREQMGVEPFPAEAWFNKAILPHLKESKLFVDVGANLGQFATHMAKRGHQVISFEPMKDTCAQLQSKTSVGGLEQNVEVHCAAASSEKKNVIFHLPDGITASAKEVSQEQAQKLEQAGKKDKLQHLETKTVDSVVGPSREVFMLKTDTQGYEMSVLNGAKELLKSGRVKFLLVEFSYWLLNAAGTKPLELLDLIAESGYICTYLAYHGVKKLSEERNSYGQLDAPNFDTRRISVGFEEFVNSLRDVNLGKPGWTDLFCWKA